MEHPIFCSAVYLFPGDLNAGGRILHCAQGWNDHAGNGFANRIETAGINLFIRRNTADSVGVCDAIERLCVNERQTGGDTNSVPAAGAVLSEHPILRSAGHLAPCDLYTAIDGILGGSEDRRCDIGNGLTNGIKAAGIGLFIRRDTSDGIVILYAASCGIPDISQRRAPHSS